jgi:hypothetical protein
MIAANQAEKPSDLGPLQALARVARVFYAPRRAAQEIRDQPNWVFPLLLTLLFSFIGAAVLFERPEWHQALQKALENSGQKLGEVEKVKLLQALKVASWAFSLATPVVGNLLIAVILWGIAVKLTGKVGFIPVFSFQLHAQMVTLIPRTMGLAWLLGHAGADASQGDLPLPFTLGYFLPRGFGSAELRAVTGSMDLFGLWYWAVVIAGLAVLSGLPWRRFLVPVALLWALTVLIAAAAILLTSPA